MEPILKCAMIPAISDRGESPPIVFDQAEDTVTYALSPQNRYDDKVHETLHGEAMKSKFN